MVEIGATVMVKPQSNRKKKNVDAENPRIGKVLGFTGYRKDALVEFSHYRETFPVEQLQMIEKRDAQ